MFYNIRIICIIGILKYMLHLIPEIIGNTKDKNYKYL